MSGRILVVDDDRAARETLFVLLKQAGYTVTGAESCQGAIETLQTDDVDLVLLDVVMPTLDGLECCRKIRAFSDVPIILVTALDGPWHEIEGFQAGADDYIPKPYHVATVLARIHALLRRRGQMLAADQLRDGLPNVLHLGPLSLDLGAEDAFFAGRKADLTPREFDLLWHLADQVGQIVDQEALLEAVWGATSPPDAGTLRVHIYRLRGKLDAVGGLGRFLVAKRGRGYLLDASVRTASPPAGDEQYR